MQAQCRSQRLALTLVIECTCTCPLPKAQEHISLLSVDATTTSKGLRRLRASFDVAWTQTGWWKHACGCQRVNLPDTVLRSHRSLLPKLGAQPRQGSSRYRKKHLNDSQTLLAQTSATRQKKPQLATGVGTSQTTVTLLHNRRQEQLRSVHTLKLVPVGTLQWYNRASCVKS